MAMTERPGDCAAVSRQVTGMLKQLYDFAESPDGEKSKKAKVLLSHYELPIKAALRNVRPGKNPFLWFFSSELTRKKTCASCSYLYDVIFLGLGPELSKLSE